MRLKRWHFLGALGILLFFRALLYQAIGPAADWTPDKPRRRPTLPFRLAFTRAYLSLDPEFFRAELRATAGRVLYSGHSSSPSPRAAAKRSRSGAMFAISTRPTRALAVDRSIDRVRARRRGALDGVSSVEARLRRRRKIPHVRSGRSCSRKAASPA